MGSKGYPHPNNDETTSYAHPQPPPAYDQSFGQQQPSARPGNNFYQPIVTQQPIQGIYCFMIIKHHKNLNVICCLCLYDIHIIHIKYTIYILAATLNIKLIIYIYNIHRYTYITHIK